MRGLANLLLLFLLFAGFYLEDCRANDNITVSKPIRDNGTIVSSGQIYKLGFFSPVNTSNRYVGIIMNVPELAVIWVANRERPLKDSAGMFTISEDGNLVVLNGQKEILWSSNVSNSVANSSARLLDTGNLVLSGQKEILWSSNVSNSVANSSARLLDTGNLVLRDNSNGRIIWESFQIPTDTFVNKMRLGASLKTKNRLTSWRSPSDPSIGSFSFGFDPPGIPEVFLWNESKPHWRSGPWDGNVFIGVPGMNSAYRNGFYMADENTESEYLKYNGVNDSILIYYILSSSGVFLEKVWYNGTGESKVTWSSLQSECDVYAKCGPFGRCNPRGSRICSCLPGFEPRDKEEWHRGNWTGGCLRKALLQCQRNSSDGEKGKPDGYLKLQNVKVPDFSYSVEFFRARREQQCRNECSNNCSCTAYAHIKGIGCMHWSGSLIDIQQFPFDGADLYVRVAHSELDNIESRNLKIAVIASTVIVGFMFIVGSAYFLWKWTTKRRGEMIKIKAMLIENEELHLYGYATLDNATDNFHSENKLGKGGFGSVYKGKLIGGQKIAVKRLSNSSSQGIEEFMNEVLVISKLQHRNLVRLLGCCVEREEKMLVYEYMPNKSLDAYLFDSRKQDLLDWNRRAIIIEGICRGLLYLHRDSRLKIIHRDLKASNILLDEDLNPKISDFGLARIFGGNQDQANTKRVVGTYGYMAPEYAMRGKFSEKSDVYSFGVLLLEIVSGKRNSSFHNDKNDLSLIGYAWKLWNEHETVTFIDPAIYDQSIEMEVLRHVHVGLLCVEECANYRPNVSTFLSMLNSEIAELPCPNLPAYNARLCFSESEYSQRSVHSFNDVSITTVVGR